jgi:pimeloyl-ACP methyl ester carboxylesterase
MKKAYVDTRDGQVHYVMAGEGKPLLLIHETPRSWRSYAQMIPYLSASFRVIAMDTLGFGNSDKAPDEYRIEDYAESTLCFLDALGITRTHVVGEKTGAAIAVELAIKAPDRVNRMVLSALPFVLNEKERSIRRGQVMSRDLITRAADGSHLSRIWQWLVETRIPGSKPVSMNDADMDLLSELVLDALRAGPGWKKMEIRMANYDPASRLPLVRSPTLVTGVKGEGTAVYTTRLHEVGPAIPNSTVKVLEGADGRLNQTHAREFSELISEFLRGPEA